MNKLQFTTPANNLYLTTNDTRRYMPLSKRFLVHYKNLVTVARLKKAAHTTRYLPDFMYDEDGEVIVKHIRIEQKVYCNDCKAYQCLPNCLPF